MFWKKITILFTWGLLLFLFDFQLKAYIHHHIPPLVFSSSVYPFGGIGGFYHWYGIDCSIVHVMNKGAAWGAFASLQQYLLCARLLIIGGIFTYLIAGRASLFRQFCLMCIAAGACGNVCDYFLYGHVIDMFYFIFWGYSFPVFNIADSSIFFGVVSLCIQSFIKDIQFKRSNALPFAD